MSLIQEVATIRNRPTTDAEKLTKARLLRHRLGERLGVALVRLNEIVTRKKPEPQKGVTDELKAALTAYVTELIQNLKVTNEPASEIADRAEKHLRVIRERFRDELSKATRSDVPFEQARSSAAGDVLQIVSREIHATRDHWLVDIASHQEQCFESRETEVRRLLQTGHS